MQHSPNSSTMILLLKYQLLSIWVRYRFNKQAISGMWQSDNTLSRSPGWKGNRQNLIEKIENKQRELRTFSSHSCFHLTTAVLFGKKGSEIKVETQDMSWLPSVTKWLGSHLHNFYAFSYWLTSRWSYSLLKAFFIPSSTSWHRFQSELFRQVFLLFFNLKMTTLLSQRARSPRLLENWWHCSRRHFYFKELNRSWAANIECWNPFKTFSYLFFLISPPGSFSHPVKCHTVTVTVYMPHDLEKNLGSWVCYESINIAC